MTGSRGATALLLQRTWWDTILNSAQTPPLAVLPVEPQSSPPALRPGYNARGPVSILAITFIWLAATAWLRPLSLPDEGRYVGVAWEMLRSGNWLVPMLDGLPYFHKPPLFYWTTASTLATFGLHELSARLPSLLAATGSAYALYFFVKRWCNEATAYTSLLVLATTPLFFGAAQFANMDMLVAACVACSILCAADAVLSLMVGRVHRLSVAGAYLFAALGTLAKGLIGMVIPGLVIGIWLLIIARPAMILRLIWLPGLVIFTIIAVPWIALMQLQYPDFLRYYFVEQHFRRLITHNFNNPMPVWFYAVVFPALTLPWSPILFGDLANGTHAETQKPEIRALMWVWLGATLVFFSIPSSKLVGYVVPAAYPLAVLVAHVLLRGRQTWFAARLPSTAALCAVAAALCLAGSIGYAFHDRNNIERLATKVRSLLAPGDRVLAVGEYPFSVPFYLHYLQPIPVVEDWDADWAHRKDNWRNELRDAANFDLVRGRHLLLRPSHLTAALCGNRWWVFGKERDILRFPELRDIQRIAHEHDNAVWLARPSDLHCASTTD